jgi:pimeloyl-ACP methyl ester carboxylesterase
LKRSLARLTPPPQTDAPARQVGFSVPPLAATPEDAAQMDAFLLHGGLVDACFIRRDDTLLVTFDNLSSVAEYNPAQPWLLHLSAKLGHSILGIMAKQKDWYRNADTPDIIRSLRDAGLFQGFQRVLFVGSSMGGFAALAYSSLLPGAAVLAFSPQSTLNKGIAPFEKRYRYGQRRWDWTAPEFLDAAAGLAPATEAYLAYDPFVPEDRAHAKRFSGSGVQQIRLPHLGHRAIRQIKDFGALTDMIGTIAKGRFDLASFAKTMRSRRHSLLWKRELFAEAERRGHRNLSLAAAHQLLKIDPEDRLAQRLIARLAPLVEGEKSKAPIDRAFKIRDGGPRGPFSGAVQHLGQALVLPERAGDTKLACGVLKADGSYVELSRAWIRARKATPKPTMQPDEQITDLPGRHLFAGHFRDHFGHFLVESTARLWALDHLPYKPDSILYLPYRGAHSAAQKAIAGQQHIFDMLGIDIPVVSYPGALRVEELFVPELGFGWLDRYAGSPAYRKFMCGRLSKVAMPEGGDKLYISRAKLAANRGGILGETVIEENLARAGFEIFHPERHPLEVQIARYRAAKTVVALDGSALHLAAYVLPADARVAMILRRSSANVADYLMQYRGFLGIAPDVINVIRRDWISGDRKRPDFRSVGELDFADLFEQLKSLGHIPETFRPDLPTEAEIAKQLCDQGDRRGGEFRALTSGEHHPDEAVE